MFVSFVLTCHCEYILRAQAPANSFRVNGPVWFVLEAVESGSGFGWEGKREDLANRFCTGSNRGSNTSRNRECRKDSGIGQLPVAHEIGADVFVIHRFQ